MKKRISAEIKAKIISLSGKIFWYWQSYYTFYSSILGISSRELENKIPHPHFNKYSATEKIIEELELNNRADVLMYLLSELYNLTEPFDKKDNPKFNEAKDELNEFKNIVGKDVLEEERKKEEVKKNIEKRRKISELEKLKSKKLDELKNDFFKYSTSKNRQEAGYWLESAFYKILELEQIEHTKPYKTESEQIDGHFKMNSWDYLVEIKWTKEPVKQKDVSIFDGKIKTKAQSTRGFILSIAGFDASAVINAENSGSPRLIFCDVQDLIAVLEERASFKDLLKTREDVLVRYGKVYKK